MRTLSILLVTLGLSMAKAKLPHQHNRFPDILAPLRGMLGISRSSHSHPHLDKHPHQQNQDSAGAETGKPGQFSGDETFQTYFPSNFPNSPYEDEFAAGGRRLPSHSDGRPPHHPDHRSPPPHSPDSSAPPRFNRANKPPQQFNPDRPPPQFSSQGAVSPQFNRVVRAPEKQSGYQFNPDGKTSLQFSSEGRPAPQFTSGRNPMTDFDSETQFRPEGRPVPQFSPEGATHFHRRPTRQHRPQVFQPEGHRFPRGHTKSPHSLDDEQSNGFSDFAFNPADFDSESFGSGSEEQRAFGQSQPSYQPSKPIPHYGGSSRPRQQDFRESFPRQVPGGGEITMDDLEKGNSGNGEKVVYFDDVYRQQGNFVQSPSNFQGELIREASGLPPMVPKFRPPQTKAQGSPSFGDNRGKESLFIPKASSQNNVHYGKPMVMSGSATPPAALKPKDQSNPDLMTSPSFRNQRTHWTPESNPVRRETHRNHSPIPVRREAHQNPEPLAAASGHNGIGDGGGDRILYHVAGHAGPYSYRFGYDTGTGYNRMFRHEEKDGNGLVKGKYGYHDKTGKLQVVNYSAHPTQGFQSERAH